MTEKKECNKRQEVGRVKEEEKWRLRQTRSKKRGKVEIQGKADNLEISANDV